MKYLQLALLLFTIFGCSNNDQKPSTTPEAPQSAAAAQLEEGEHLFKINCAQCHMPAKDFAAPALAAVEKRWANKSLLYEFVRNSQEVIKKDKYAADLFEKWKQAPMLPFEDLTNAEIDAIFAYCNSVAPGQ